LKPAFKADGTITAGNASGLNDGAAFEILTRRSTAQKRGLKAIANFLDYTIVGCDPRFMGMGPVGAIKNLQSQLWGLSYLSQPCCGYYSSP